MPWWKWALAVGAVVAVAWALFVVVLLITGRRSEARALAGFVPDCIVLVRRLLADERVPRSRKLLLAGLLAYLALPIDLVPDFIPVAGQLDDLLILALVLRAVLRSAGPELVGELWPGPEASLRVVLRAVG
ncbi:MAG: YkvA family protein [Solirubrobacteraceae bacterium]